MKTSLTKIIATAAVTLALVACGKGLSVKEDWTEYQVQSAKLQQELSGKQKELMVKMQGLQQNPENADAVFAETDKMMADAKAALQKLKPQTEPVKKFHDSNLKAIDSMSTDMKSLLEAVKAKDMNKLQEANKSFQKTMMDLQAAQSEVLKEVAK
jgi:hypothetical protein